jgi:hypothetical protein
MRLLPKGLVKAGIAFILGSSLKEKLIEAFRIVV